MSTLESRLASTPLSGSNAAFVEELYERYLADPASVPADWQRWFAANGAPGDVAHGPIVAELERRAHAPRRAAAPAAAALDDADLAKQAAVMDLIEAFRLRGHLAANLCPIQFLERPAVPDLDPAAHGLTAADRAREFAVAGMYGAERMKLDELVARARNTYCDTVGWEFLHCSDFEERGWLAERIEGKRPEWSAEQRRALLEHLTAAEGLERFLHTKYVGQKRFSLEGGDSLIPLLQETIQQCGAQGVKEIVIGMAHRGRLNVLVNVLGKSPTDLFSEFEGKHDHEGHHEDHSGDVKYHMGFSSDVATPGGNVHLALAFNPSHLEIVNPVVEGSVRARQDRRGDAGGKQVVPILIHGDAAFACQGVVMETMQLSLARGFRTGGTLHIVVNNQVGFTTHRPDDARSTRYCTDLGKMFEVPVFHVNGDDPEAVLFVARLALDYRMRFGKDVIIDLVCYRRHGHNEADEPAATQPTMYKKVRAQKTTRALYAERLVAAGVIDAKDPEAMGEAYRDGLVSGRSLAAKRVGDKGDEFTVDWSKYNKPGADQAPFATGVPLERLRALGSALTAVPAGFELHPRVAKIVEDRVRMFGGEQPLDWGAAETLAYATLLGEGFGVRLCGQDAGRGTFFHRHAVWHEQKTGATHLALNALGGVGPSAKAGRFTVIDSLLSEEAVMGFEYGYASAEPTSLVIWEAQFGDFANGAQAVIDQFIAAGEAKWRRMNGLALFLPHGYEGQGPEHSSARLERYLQLCAQRNMQVCVPSTPAQAFHMIRRQLARPVRKPLIVMTPKSLLRHKLATSTLNELSVGEFRTLIPEVDDIKPAKVERVVFCSGKVYYDLLEARRAANRTDVAIVRVEQLYPFPAAEYEAEIARYSNARDVVWCQEEPENQGAWWQVHHRLVAPLKARHTLHYAGRAASASTAAGHHNVHVEEQRALVESALKLAPSKKEKA